VAPGWWLAARTPRRCRCIDTVHLEVARGTSLDSARRRRTDVASPLLARTPPALYVPDLNLDAKSIAGTEGATLPFWSPDGRSLAYFTEGKLMKVSLPNGAPPQ
jgi:hypothetical protein